ncbi:MAG: ABC transporter substrate-binding protein [Pseudomonadota bacterium]
MPIGRFLVAFVLALVVVPAGLRAESGVDDERILFGQSAALEGPAAALGRGMQTGILAAFNQVNLHGGVYGRRLELVTYDDGYEPEQAIINVNRLIDQDDVFALIGEVGTPTSSAVQPIATQRGVPFLAPFTGAAFLRDSALDNVVNVRASYDQEAEAWVTYLTEDLGLTRIAILYQDDSFGRAGLDGVRQALAARDMTLVAEGTYMRNTTAVKRALLAIRKETPEAIVIVGAYEPAAAFITLAREIGLDPVFVAISFVGSKALAEALGDDGAGVIVTQVVPLPDDIAIPLVADYNAALAALDPQLEPGFVSLEGYIAGRLVIAALEAAGPDVTRQDLLTAIRDLGTFELGGLAMEFGPGDNQGMDTVFFTVLDDNGTFNAVADTDE